MPRREPLPPPDADGDPIDDDERGAELPKVVFILGGIGFGLGILLLILVASSG